jgi:hypothetical protein
MVTRLVILVIGLGMLAFGVLLVAWSAQTAYSFQWRLERGDAVRTDARVEDLRTLENEETSQVTHELRYVFKVQGDDREYSFDDDIWMLEQGDGWVDVPESTWTESRESNEIDVEYLDGDPAVNQPVEARRGIGSTILFFVLGLVATAIGALLTFGPLLGRRRRRRREATETAPHLTAG